MEDEPLGQQGKRCLKQKTKQKEDHKGNLESYCQSCSWHVFSSLNNGIMTSASKAAVWDDDTKLVKNLNLTLSLCVLGCRLNRAGQTPLGQPSEGLDGLHCLLKIKSASSCAK